ncbi:MAG: hypothetical protein ACR2L8_12140 [Solirubrobacteraceae bacterium]
MSDTGLESRSRARCSGPPSATRRSAWRSWTRPTGSEFVTDQETADLLLARGVDYAQGFHISRPGHVEGVLGALSS